MSLLILALVVVGIFILWHFLPQTEKKPPQPSPKFRLDPRVNSDEQLWQSFVEEHCESPAEIAFLRAMIEAHAMRPEAGSLVANDLRLDFQVEEGRYRVDFLVNRWLVVEIDGAAYHSSPEARARDQARDRYFEGLGYTVLRLPAKLVFRTPKDAVKAVDSALALGRRETAPAPTPTDGFSRLAQTAAAFRQNAEVAEKNQAVRRALASSDLAISAEHSALEAAINLAKQRAEHAAWLASLDEEGRDLYRQCVADLEAAVDGTVGATLPPQRRAFDKPAMTGDDWVDSRVAEGFRLQTERRLEMFQSIRSRLAADASIRANMLDALIDIGRDDLWASVN